MALLEEEQAFQSSGPRGCACAAATLSDTLAQFDAACRYESIAKGQLVSPSLPQHAVTPKQVHPRTLAPNPLHARPCVAFVPAHAPPADFRQSSRMSARGRACDGGAAAAAVPPHLCTPTHGVPALTPPPHSLASRSWMTCAAPSCCAVQWSPPSSTATQVLPPLFARFIFARYILQWR
jgi:hypothetical protein